MPRRLFIGMSRQQGLYHRVDTARIAYHLHPVLADSGEFALDTNGRGAACEGAKLALPGHLPAALVVVADTAGAGGEDRGLDALNCRFRHIETECVHPQTPRACCS